MLSEKPWTMTTSVYKSQLPRTTMLKYIFFKHTSKKTGTLYFRLKWFFLHFRFLPLLETKLLLTSCSYGETRTPRENHR